MLSPGKCWLVVTSIRELTPALIKLSEGCSASGWQLLVIGDAKGPFNNGLAYGEVMTLPEQLASEIALAQSLPQGHYSRKNLGYATAWSRGADVVVETDDDNFPLPNFWKLPERALSGRVAKKSLWVNVYQYFCDTRIWPRGYPLSRILSVDGADRVHVLKEPLAAPVHQYLASGDPDVDAIFRLTHDEFPEFREEDPLLLVPGTFCPTNSQATVWFREVKELMYLPSTCSFRLTDIWRGLIAQRIMGECGQSTAFHSPRVRQERNDHDLMADFAAEIEGYLGSDRFVDVLRAIDLAPFASNRAAALRVCYQRLVEEEFFQEQELPILEDWLASVSGQ